MIERTGVTRRNEKARHTVGNQTIDSVVDALAHCETEQRIGVVREIAERLEPAQLHHMLSAFEEAAKHRVCDWCDSNMAKAKLASEAGDDEMARRLLESVIHVEITNWEAHRDLAGVLERSADFAGAWMHYTLAFHFGWECADATAAIDRVRSHMNSETGKLHRQ